MTDRDELPLSGVRVIDATDERGGACGRFLSELGADVLLVEPPEGAAVRRTAPLCDGESLRFALQHAGKRSLAIDPGRPAAAERLRALLRQADIWIASTRLHDFAAHGFGPEALRTAFPRLVVMTITEFGRTRPRRDWRATDPVHVAMSGFLSRSGLPGRPPLIPPGAMAHEAACVQAAWAALLAYWNRLRGGDGDDLDFSIFDSVVQSLDPHFGAAGTAAVAAGAVGHAIPRGRVDVPYYPIFRVRDGFVRIVSVSPRQWKALFAWIGEPEAFAHPRFLQTPARFAVADAINRIVADFVASQTVAELMAEGQRRGLPIAPVLTPERALQSAHFEARGAIAVRAFSPRQQGALPTGYVEIDHQRAGFWRRAPMLDEGSPWSERPAEPRPRPVAQPAGGVRPLAGLRVLDLGVIVMGGEAARLFADQGADVLKIESRAFPDGARGDHGGPMHPSFAVGHRNMRSVGLNLRHAGGLELFRRLVAKADVLLSNFKPGTLEKLSLGYDDLAQVNPRLVVVSSSAFGDTGPWSDWMGYGPLVRSASGVTSLWSYDDDQGLFGETGLTYPDHFVARVVDVAALASLIRRERTGRGGHVRSSQAEAVLMVLGEALLAASLGVDSAARPDAPWGVFPCAGDDEWCVVTVRNDADWRGLVAALQDPILVDRADLRTAEGRRACRTEIDAWVSAWTARLDPGAAAEALQAAGVPAGPMRRGAELPDDPQLRARAQLRRMRQTELSEPLWVESGPSLSQTLAAPPLRPAPMAGAHTRAACAEWLGLGAAEIDALIASGALEEFAPLGAG